MQRYGRKRIFAGFEIRFMALAVLFLEHWRYFCVDWRCGCQDKGKNVYLPALKLGFMVVATQFLEHWRFFFVNWRYGCQDMDEKVYSPALKSGL